MLLRVLGVLEILGQTGSPADTSGTSQTRVWVQPKDQQQAPKAQVQVEQPLAAPIIEIPPVISFTEDEQRKYERFRKINPPQFQRRKTKDAHDFLTTCRELLDTVELAETHDVRYVTLQFRGPVREWQRTYSRPLLVGSPQMIWETFSSALYDRFVPWSVLEESLLRFESLRQGTMMIRV